MSMKASNFGRFGFENPVHHQEIQCHGVASNWVSMPHRALKPNVTGGPWCLEILVERMKPIYCTRYS